MLGSVDIRVRPIRFAYLVDPKKQAQIRDAIRLSSTLWGGADFPIIPLYNRMPASWRDPVKAPPAKNVFLGYIDAFDPDMLVQMSADLPAYVQEAGRKVIKLHEIWETLDEGLTRSPRVGVGVFELMHDLFQEHFRYKAKYPPRIVLPKIPNQLSLFWTAVFGELPEKIAEGVRRHFAKPLEIEDVEFTADRLEEVMAPDVLFPRRIVQHGLNSQGQISPRGNASVFFMDARAPEDVIDFWNLRAMGRIVIPLPKQLAEHDQFRKFLFDFLRTHRRHWRHDPKVCNVASIIVSRHSTMAEVQEYAKAIKIERPAGDPSTDGFFTLQRWYPRVWDAWARDKDNAVPHDSYADTEDRIDLDDPKDLKVRFKPVFPPFADAAGIHSEGKCANEVEFRFYGATQYLAEAFPPSAGKNFDRAISGFLALRGGWRVGRNGLVKIVASSMSESRDIPLAQDLVFAWLQDKGWKPTLSPPGLLAREIFRAVQGYPWMLANQKLLGLLEHMNGGNVRPDGTPAKKEMLSQERELAVSVVRGRFGQFSGANLYPYLLSRGVFKLGLRMQCPLCTRHSWYPLESVRETFTCPKCLNPFPALDHIEEAKWYYKTAGPFSVPNYADGAYVVLLTLHCFDDHKMSTMRTTPAFSFVAEQANKERLEADFALFWQEAIFGERREGLAIGECKTYGVFDEKDFRRVRHTAKTFPGAVLVFSTLRKELTPQEIVKIASIAKAGRKYWKSNRPINPVLILTAKELFSEHGAPYCWDDEVKARFPNLHGLIDLCDATQQLYLKLPSWHKDWHEKWEKRRQRWLATKQQQPPSGP